MHREAGHAGSTAAGRQGGWREKGGSLVLVEPLQCREDNGSRYVGLWLLHGRSLGCVVPAARVSEAPVRGVRGPRETASSSRLCNTGKVQGVHSTFCIHKIGSAIDPGLKHLRETKMAYGRVLPGPLRCSDVPLYDSVVDSHGHGVVGTLILKRWIVHNVFVQSVCLDGASFQRHKGR